MHGFYHVVQGAINEGIEVTTTKAEASMTTTIRMIQQCHSRRLV
jgi:hypothetical protein